MSITRERIFEAADQLAAKGKAVTLAAVREELGAGSYMTITKAVIEWKAAQAAKTKPTTEPIQEAPEADQGREENPSHFGL